MDQILDIDIEKMSFGGEGIGYQDGKVIFVEGTLPGDKAKIKIYREKIICQSIPHGAHRTIKKIECHRLALTATPAEAVLG